MFPALCAGLSGALFANVIGLSALFEFFFGALFPRFRFFGSYEENLLQDASVGRFIGPSVHRTVRQ